MAFGGRELRLILSIQSYGTTNIARLRRDIAQLSSAAEAANKRQQMLQSRLEGQQLRAARIAQRIDRMTVGTGRIQGLIQEARLSARGLQIYEQRGALVRKENQLLTDLSRKRAQIAATERAIADPTRALRTTVAQSRLEGRALDIARARAAFPERELRLRSSLNLNAARQIQLQKTLNRAHVTTEHITQGLQGNYADLTKHQEMWARRMIATQQAATRLNSQMARLPAELAKVNTQAATLTKQEQLQVALVAKQADAVAALNEQLFVQQSEYANIQARLAAIAGQRDVLLAQEKTLTIEEQKRLTLLEQETVALRAQEASLVRQQKEIAATRAELAVMPRIISTAEIPKAAQAMEHTGRQVAHLGRTAQFTGLLMTAAFGLAAGSFANFSERVSLAATQMRDIGAPITQTAERAKELQDRIIDLGMEFPASATEMSEAAYEIFSSMNIVRGGVVNTAKGFELLETANKAAVAGGVELEEATDAMIIVLNNFDPQLRNTSKLLDEMFTVVRFGKMHLDDLGAAMKFIAPIAKTTGLEFSDVGAALAALSILTGSAENSAMGLARAIEMFRLPVVQEGFKRWGVTITDAYHRLLPLNVVMDRLIKGFPGLATGQQSAIEALIQITKASEQTKVGVQGTIQARRAIANLATSMDLYDNILSNVTKNQGEFNLAFQARRLDPGVQWQIFLRQMQTLVIVIGREALPVFLALGKRVESFIRWFKDLNPTVRRSIIQIATFVGILALLGGTMLNVVGSLYALRANMVLMSLATEGATKRFLALRIAIGSLALLGLGILVAEVYDLKTAVVVMTTAWLIWKTKVLQSVAAAIAASITGGVSITAANVTAATESALAWQFANRAFLANQASNVVATRVATQAIVTTNVIAAGAVKAAWRTALIATGWGALAVAAGIAVELIIRHWDRFRAFFIALRAALKETWKQLMLKELPGLALVGVGYILKTFTPFLSFLSSLASLIPGIGDTIAKVIQPADLIIGRGKKLMAEGGKDFGETFGEAFDKAMDSFERGRKTKGKEQASDLVKEYNKIFRGLVSEDFLKRQEDFLNALNPDANGLTDAASLTKRRAQEIAQAYENMQQKIGSAVDNLTQIYDRFKQENEQALGTIFGGPAMEGVFGDVFRQINDLLRQFGIQIPVPFELLRRDMDQQLEYFKRWRSDLDKLLARGAPLEMIDQIRALGPEAIPLIEGLLGASPKQFKKYVQDFKTGQKLIRQATKADMDRQLKEWEKHGKNIAWQLINGIASDPAQAKLRAGFRQYVINTFGDVLKSQMTKEVQIAMQQAMKELAESKAAEAAATVAAKGIKPPPVPTIAQMNIPTTRQELERTRKQLNDLKAQMIQETFAGMAPTEKQQARLQALFKREKRLEAHLARERELRSIRQQLRRGREAGRENITITYQGDTVTVKADGATPAAVYRALNKHQFRKKTKHGYKGQRR